MKTHTCKHLIETNELHDLIKNKREHLLFDTSWYNIRQGEKDKNSFDDHDQAERIEGSISFNSIVTSNENPNFSFFFPTQEEFFSYLRKLLLESLMDIKINTLENLPVIFYEKDEIFYAPRIWFMFKLHGFQNVQILNGGLNKWLNEERDVMATDGNAQGNGHLPQSDKIIQVDKLIKEHVEKNKKQISENRKRSIYHYADIDNFVTGRKKQNDDMGLFVLVDTRPNSSFSALLPINEKEKVDNFIPFSVNIPYHHFIRSHDEKYKFFTFKNEAEIKNICDQYDLLNEQKTVISTCNKGISACVLLFLLHQLNKPLHQLALYYGSFVDYKFRKYALQ
ncbi:Tat binding protein 1(TBP-1)-interacting protein [Plasmodium cynomolgi strain B]|uniref:Tat binding protein 1(TBP-1)-interacting protein n=1 Tax=Plasmodium cynomolgi (strain B) TaxID=1120755 RepID=K6UZW4_PLACD|nr:Tat binding protein 1(TBP-1)-interacting protein [Plasmodium cynomolgi strain B]GAB68275.1 Tat binding protein 1(TBP-1)-interacting protein [Plasmodium cynomolgi strain B]